MKKLLSLLLVGMFTGISFASANTVDGFTSESDISVYNFSNSSEIYDEYAGNGNYICISSSDIPFYLSMNAFENSNPEYTYVNSSIKCFSDNSLLSYSDYTMNIYSDIVEYTEKEISGKIYYSSSPITYSSSNGGGDSSDTPLLGGVGQDFASGITSGVGSLTSGISNVLPTLILLMLPLFIIWLFFKYIRSYLKHVLVGNKPRGDDIANCNLTVNKYGQFEHHIIGQHDRGDYVDIPGVGLVGKDELPYYLDENLNFKAKEYKQDHTTFDTRDPGLPGDDYYRRSENIEEEAYYYEKYL